MNQQGVRWTADQALALAPDAATGRAGSRLDVAGAWSGAGCSDAGVVWGLCEDGGGVPHRTVVDTAGPVYRCSCPHRGSACRHVLGLLLRWAAGPSAVPSGAASPEWAERWREELCAGPGAAGGAVAAGAVGPAGAGVRGPSDVRAAQRRAAARAARVTAGAEELERRLSDLLREGLASAGHAESGVWEETARRMVDAQAPGLAGRARDLAAIPDSGPGWPVRMLEESALTHLLGRAWLSVDRLPDPLAATVRTRVGLPATAEGPAVRDRWLVLCQYDTPDGRLTTRRIWLYGEGSGRTALLLSFGAAGRAPELALPVGAVLDAEVTSYPGAGRLRAELGRQFAAPAPGEAPPPGGTAGDALHAYGLALRQDPWLDSWPVTLRDSVPAPTGGGGWQLADADGTAALPLSRAAVSGQGLWRLAALSGGAPVTVFGECGHRGFTPLAAWGPDASGPVSLT
ncbi:MULTISPECIES: SWIM zinc finger family protein [unclassified Streptomyces]|uniref:SWIM zinc finger family protein n=1 Tax=unclassified Streptomyces TaxID=2593676 RepID=UPI000A47D7BF|nr:MULTISPECIES: SWIM zinc finger family protein [unclassified Streptomyces]